MIATVFLPATRYPGSLILGLLEDGRGFRASMWMEKPVEPRWAAVKHWVAWVPGFTSKRLVFEWNKPRWWGFFREKKTCQTSFWRRRNKTPVIYRICCKVASETFLDKMFCSVFKVLQWHKAKCLVQQLFDVGYMASALEPQHINSGATAKVENIFTVNVSHVFGTRGGSAASVSWHPLWLE